jgi:hypothetical protein
MRVNKLAKSMLAGVILAGTGISASAVAADVLVMPSKVAYARTASVPQAVINECGLPEKLAMFIHENAAGHFDQLIMDDGTRKPARGAKVLKVEITDVMGTGGGAWSGAKAVGIKGTLSQNGKVLGNFTARRYSGGGAFGGFKGTCAILGRCVKTLGQDVSRFLASPAQGMHLGD